MKREKLNGVVTLRLTNNVYSQVNDEAARLGVRPADILRLSVSIGLGAIRASEQSAIQYAAKGERHATS